MQFSSPSLFENGAVQKGYLFILTGGKKGRLSLKKKPSSVFTFKESAPLHEDELKKTQNYRAFLSKELAKTKMLHKEAKEAAESKLQAVYCMEKRVQKSREQMELFSKKKMFWEARCAEQKKEFEEDLELLNKIMNEREEAHAHVNDMYEKERFGREAIEKLDGKIAGLKSAQDKQKKAAQGRE